MADLSPAAQAVLDAFCASEGGVYLEGDPERIAAAFRAAADYAIHSTYASTPSNDWGDGWEEGVRNTAHGLLAIANELDPQP